MENQINYFLDLMSTDGGCDLREKDGFYDSLYGQENQSNEQTTETSRDSLDVGCDRILGFHCRVCGPICPVLDEWDKPF